MKLSTNKNFDSGSNHCNLIIYNSTVSAHTIIIIIIIFNVVFREVYVGMKKLIDY